MSESVYLLYKIRKVSYRQAVRQNAWMFLIHEMKAVQAARNRGRACNTEADMKKASKGEYGYFRYERKRRALMTFILLLIPVTLF